MNNIVSFEIFETNLFTLLPELFLLISIFILLIFGTLYNGSFFYKYPILTNSLG